MRTFIILLSLVACCLAVLPVKNVDTVRASFTDANIEKVVNQINKEQAASYFYQAYSKFFKRGDIALDGFSKWFATAAKEENDHAEKLMDYLNMRGAEINLDDVKLQTICDKVTEKLSDFPQFNRREACICNFMSRDLTHTDTECLKGQTAWFAGLQAMQDSLVLERYVNDALLTLHKETSSDPHLSHMLEHDFLGEQVDSIKQYADYITQLTRVGSGFGEYEFDKTLQ
ncbi:yolk ferritin-like [Mizuhopecten yessoensis]|uniref:Ferritin n=1 Tax=Mizuhopecten yessoensis TaxID=6573 RepID=W5U7T1_MIZYE|nr:yolk ferritin-like [Mizuhopecten yessoensis]AHH31562.1 ferritin [Mizuhopecten yessoensis]OWF56610.1 Yolk ferritin [Mizuhopecten yessoensis]